MENALYAGNNIVLPIVGAKENMVYEAMKERNDIDGYSRWNNDVEYGQRPERRDISKNNELYGQYFDSYGRVGGEDIGRNDRKSQETQSKEIAPVKEGGKASSEDGVFLMVKITHSIL